MNITRKDFLKGAATGLAGAAAIGLTGAVGAAEEGGITAAQYSSAKWAFEIAPDPIPDSQIAEVYEVEIIVIGAGTAGLCTAYSAVQSGADVILFSASSMPVSRGGSNHAVYSKVMERMGVPRYDIDTVYRRELVTNGGQVDVRKWYKFVNNSEEAMNWMIDIMESEGFEGTLETGPAYPLGDPCYTPSAAHSFINEEFPTVGSAQQGLVLTMAKRFEEAGGRIYYSHVAKQLIREDNNTGRVTGAIAQRADGSYVKFMGKKAVVLATGDFSADRDMLTKYCPEMLPFQNPEKAEAQVDYDQRSGFGGCYKGDGHKMGLWIGAAWQHNQHTAPMVMSVGNTATKPYEGHTGLKLNALGERYTNEAVQLAVSAGALFSQPGHVAFCIWDNNYAAGETDWLPRGRADAAPLTEDEIRATFGEGFDTLDAAIESLGLPLEATKASIARYNALCEGGHDDDFHKPMKYMKPIKEPPFYAGAEGTIFLTTCGGLRTNSNLQVCDENDQPIPGLYNVGIMTGDMYAGYYTFMLEGWNYGCCCITFGYLTGKHIAENE